MITYKSSTLIETIFILQKKQQKSQNFTCGLFYVYVSDHLTCFAILECPSKILKQTRPKVRVDNKASIQTSIQDLQNVNVNIYEDANTRSNFKTFLDIYKKPYGKDFPVQTQSRQ